MSKLEQLIQKYCPDGVEYKTIGDVTKSICSGLNPRKNFTLNSSDADCNYLTVKEMTSGKIVFSDKTDKITKEAVGIIQNRSRLAVDDILLSGIGTIGKVAIVDIPVGDWNCSESVLLLKPNQSIIVPKYLKYILEGDEVQTYFCIHATGSTLKGIRQKDLVTLEIPVPPLPVQEEIVRVLDTFTELQAELQAELQKRLQQYNYYRDNLFLFEGRSDVQWKKLGDIASIKTGRRFVRTDIRESGVPCFHYGDLYTYYGLTATQTRGYLDAELAKKLRFAQPNDVVVVCAGENDMDLGVGVAWLGKEPAVVHDACCILHHNQNPRYISHFLRTHNYHLQMKRYVKNGKISSLPASGLAEALIPIPSLEEQERIASILDRFDTLTNDLTAGLPAEIEKRRQQYEYYRDKLLTFRRA